jgi:membrane fusion protein, multidrug efflux system
VNDSTSVIDRPAVAPRQGLRLSRKHLLLSLGAVLLIVALGWRYHWWNIGRFVERTNDAYVGGDVTEISPHVSGFITTILVSDNQRQ